MLKNKKINKFIFIIVVIMLLFVIGVDSNNSESSKASGFIGSIFSPVQKVFYSIGQTFSNSFDSLLNISKIREENLQLKERSAELQDENIKLKSIVNNSDALIDEYEMIKSIKYDYVLSQIISRDTTNWFGRFTIDKGINNGIKIDDIVIKAIRTEKSIVQIGLVGKVVDVGENWSKVVAINDIKSSASFKILRTNEGGVLKGTFDRNIEGFMFDQTDDLLVGDEVLTSGLGEIYLPNLYIGKISKVEKTLDLLTEKITINSEIDFTKLYEVYIIKVVR